MSRTTQLEALSRPGIVVVLALWVGADADADAETLRVPSTYPTIQAAADSAAAFDTISVAPGTYLENVDSNDKFLVFLSECGAAATIVDGGQNGSVFRLEGGGVIDGFTIRNGQAAHGGGIFCDALSRDDPAGRIGNNLIMNNRAGYVVDSGLGGGLYLAPDTGEYLIASNVFQDNYAGDSGGGVYDFGGRNSVVGNSFLKNGTHVCGGGLWAGSTFVKSNLFLDNWSDNSGGGLCGGGIEITNNTIVGSHTNNSIPQGTGMNIGLGSPLVANNVVAFSTGPAGRQSGIGMRCWDSSIFGDPRVECNNSWGNDGGDYYYSEQAPCDTAGSGNISANPLFCEGTYELEASSPCAPDNSTCGLMGAFDVACGPTLTRITTWGRLKSSY